MKFRLSNVLLLLMAAVFSYISVKLVCIPWKQKYIQVVDTMTKQKCPSFPSALTLLKLSHLGDPTTSNQHFKFLPSFPEFTRVDCKAIFEGDMNAIQKGKSMKVEMYDILYKENSIFKQAQNCTEFRQHHGYNSVPSTKEEKEFPIAYSIVFHKDVAQINILLKAIYRPHNQYCLHIDAYANDTVRSAIRAVAACFDNVFLVSRSEYITYGGFSRLRADINCMQDLLSRKQRWKYLINLPGQEYPLKTNLEIVKILKLYNGFNDIEGITGRRMLHNRYLYKFKYVPDGNGRSKLVITNQLTAKPPYNITIVKGSAYGVFSRDFVHFVVNSNISKRFLKWCKDINSPDEYFWSTLHHNTHLGTPGGYSGRPDDKPWLAAYAGWAGVDKCEGKFVRSVCVFGVGDLPLLMTKKELFANKFYLDFQPAALHCMEEWIYNKTLTPLPFDSMYYRTLPFVKKRH